MTDFTLINRPEKLTLKVKWKELFPTTTSIIVYIIYISLFVNMGLITKAAQKSDPNFSYSSIVLVIEFCKLTVAFLIKLKDCNFDIVQVKNLITNNYRFLCLYCIPAGLYVVYNNLSYVSLKYFNPATYFLFMNFRSVMLGPIYQYFFAKKLSRTQWISLWLLTISCILKQVDISESEPKNSNSPTENFAWYAIVILLIQLISSVLANVYNEFLLKKDNGLDLWTQNLFMYINGFLLNLIFIYFKQFAVEDPKSSNNNYQDAADFETGAHTNYGIINFFAQFNFAHYCLIANQVALGISASMLLKYLNSLLKALATAGEMVLSAITQYLFFAIAVENGKDYLAFMIGIFSVYIYALNPVKDQKRSSLQTEKVREKGEDAMLLDKKQVEVV